MPIQVSLSRKTKQKKHSCRFFSAIISNLDASLSAEPNKENLNLKRKSWKFFPVICCFVESSRKHAPGGWWKCLSEAAIASKFGDRPRRPWPVPSPSWEDKQRIHADNLLPQQWILQRPVHEESILFSLKSHSSPHIKPRLRSTSAVYIFSFRRMSPCSKTRLPAERPGCIVSSYSFCTRNTKIEFIAGP